MAVSLTGIDYEAVFTNEDGAMNGMMKEMVDGIIGILECKELTCPQSPSSLSPEGSQRAHWTNKIPPLPG
jgi:hypothetical protein